MRDMTAGMAASFGAPNIVPVLFVEMLFDAGDGGPVRLWNGYGDFSWDGKTWQGVASLGGVSAVEETVDIQDTSCTLQLNGVDPANISLVLNTQFIDRTVNVWRGNMEVGTAATLIPDPILLFEGRMGECTINEDPSTGTASVQVQAEAFIVDLLLTNERRYTDKDQKEEYPGDLGLEFVASIPTKEVVWGGTKK